MSSTLSTSKSIKITYTINPPSDLPLDEINAKALAVSKSHVFEVLPQLSSSKQAPESSSTTQAPESSTTQAPVPSTQGRETTLKQPLRSSSSSLTNPEKAYYNALLVSLAEARSVVGEELTVWRDVIGKREGVVVVKDEEEEDEEEE
ncbi:hypothetical protein CVT24_013169 [Panaeolus cyanescens]|uniref:Uncharacterized protein n=1 Tax=Panaeolus cyanescens TaxID=181874 RepID=A0A409X266_9AGAR|nr:hypothetical protein CVT24_013169 [Panaeolus cyanescens]